MNWETLRINLRQRINKTNKWNKHVAIIDERDTQYSVLLWEYDNHKVEARSKDYEFLCTIKECIEMYLEETEKEEQYEGQ